MRSDGAPRSRVADPRIVSIAVVVVLVALAVAWIVTPLASLLDPESLVQYEQAIRASPFAPFALVLVFVAAGLVATPATLMVGATVLLFGAWPGALYAFVGMLANAITIYGIGRLAGRRLVEDWLGRRPDSIVATFAARLERRGLVAVALLKLTPIPFSLQNIVAGALRIGFMDFVCGTALGIVPIIALMAGIATRLDAWLAQPDRTGALALVGLVVAVIAIAWSLGRWAVRRQDR